MGKSAALQMMDDVAPAEEKKEEKKVTPLEENQAPKADKSEENLPDPTKNTEPSPEEKAADIDTNEEDKKEEKFGYAANGKKFVDAMEEKHHKIFEDYQEREKDVKPVWDTRVMDLKDSKV
tara:strand:- start:88 stop:450 length:363 start_codon:yes stop_codon:yes gene_type:complete